MSVTKDQYEVLEALGTGSFGTVSRIRRKADGKILVWKEINFGGMSEKEKTQLVAEVNILRELRNPFVVRYHDRIVDKPRTRLYIIMEHCSGGDLGRIIKRSRQNRTHVEESFIWKVFAQVVMALKECHRRVENGECKPILHRDLKPANILLDGEQNIKMADFGLAKELSSQSKLAQTNVGTPFYMAPEIINERDYDEKSDIWSLGCLLYELAALKPPFDATNAVSLAQKINTGKYLRIPSKYSDALFDAIRMMLQVDPRKRPRVEDLEVLPALQAALASSRSLMQDFKFQSTHASKMREIKAREDAVAAKEERLAQLEAQLKEKEQLLGSREQALLKEVEAFSARQHAWERQHAKPSAAPAARRMSYDRVTEQMVVDDDADYTYHEPTAQQEYVHIELPASLLQHPADEEAARRGPVPVPAKPTFEIFDDKRADGTFAMGALPPAPPGRYIPRKPAHAPIKTGAELAKENIHPMKLHPATKGMSNPVILTSNKENDPKAINRHRSMPADIAADMTFQSPTKKRCSEVTKPVLRANMGKPSSAALPPTVQIDLDALLRPRYNR